MIRLRRQPLLNEGGIANPRLPHRTSSSTADALSSSTASMTSTPASTILCSMWMRTPCWTASIARSGKTQSFAFACLRGSDQGRGRAILLAASLGWVRHAAGGQIPVDRPVEGHEHRLE